jgi:Domain of unknown function (DUF1931)
MVRWMTVDKFERFFRAAAGLDVDRNDLERYSDFVNRKIHDLLLRGKTAATENGRDIIQPCDLPITKGLQESIHQFRKLDEDIEPKSILEAIASLPPLDLIYGDETEERLPGVVGGLSVTLARTFIIIDPELKNPQTKHWERAFRIFDLLLDFRSASVDGCGSRTLVAAQLERVKTLEKADHPNLFPYLCGRRRAAGGH